MKKRKPRSGPYPVVSLGAEYLVMGHLMRRNVLAFKAPKFTRGCDLICTHPEASRKGRQVRVQVRSRLGGGGERRFPVQADTLGLFDYLIIVHLNIRPPGARAGSGAAGGEPGTPEFYTFPVEFIRRHMREEGRRGRVEIEGLDLARFRNEAGFEQIAGALSVGHPGASA